MSDTKRYNMVIPAELFNELQTVADKNGTTVAELLRRFIKLGLVAISMEGKDGLYIKEGESTRQLVLI